MHALEYLWSLGEAFDAAALRRRVEERSELFERLPGLVAKAFLLDAETRRFGGFYIWRSEADAERFLESPLFAQSRAAMGEPEIRRYEIPAFVGPASETVTLPSKRLAFNHAMVYVDDVPRAVSFYAERLGFRKIEQMEGYARLEAPGGRSTLGIHQKPAGPVAQPPEIRLYFEVDDLQGFCDGLARAGVEFVQPPRAMPWGWTHAYLKDPDGHELSIYRAGEARFLPTM
jgi:catechol 2,3-dioxygenase-like lactoylglutathione lyase family enzyme